LPAPGSSHTAPTLPSGQHHEPSAGRGLLRACLSGFPDSTDEEDFAVCKSASVWGLSVPLVTAEAASIAVALGASHQPLTPKLPQLLSTATYLALSLLPALALSVGALARRGGAWRRAARQREGLACAARAVAALAAVLAARGLAGEGLRGAYAVMGAWPALQVACLQVGRTRMQCAPEPGWSGKGIGVRV
jgi:hypothetical protein